jgi:preprotein translocase subunit SecG
MEQVLIVAHLLIVVAMIVVILLQRSEGGALGIGGGGSGGLMSVRGQANLLTRTTIILASLFFATSIGLTILSQVNPGSASIVDRAAEQIPENISVLDALSQMQGETPPSRDAGAGDATPVNADPIGNLPGDAAPAESAPADAGAPPAPVSQ